MNRKRSWRRRLALLAALLVAGLGALVVGPASPAQAAPGGVICFPIFNGNGQVINWVCFEIPVLIDPDPDPDPCLCPDWAIEILIDPVLPEDLRTRLFDRVGAGLELIGQAAAADNPRVAYRLREQARSAFMEAARLGGEGAGYRLGQVGVRGRDAAFDPQPNPWLEAGGAHLARGLTALSGPDPSPWDEAQQEFQLAYEILKGPSPY